MTARVAIVGWGKIAPKHAEVLRACGVEIVAAASRSEGGRTAATTDGVARTYADVSALLDAERPRGLDGVVVCPAFPGVFDIAARVIAAGVPALVEKPPGTSLRELDALIALQHKSGAPVVVGLNRRHYSVIEKAIAHAGGRDAITGVFIEWSEDPAHVLKTHPRDAVRRWVFGNTLHGLDLLTTLAGPCPDVGVVGRSLGEPLRWQMALQGLSSRGALVSFSSTWDAPGRWRVSFTASGRRYVFAPLETCTVIAREGESTIAPDDDDVRFKAGFLRQARAFVAAMTGRADPAHSLESARPAMVLAERLTNAVDPDGSAGR